MTKLFFNDQNIKNIIIPSTTNTTKTLTNFVSKANSINIPNDFPQAGTLKNCISNISSLNDQLKEITIWLTQSRIEYKNAIDDINDYISKIHSVEIETRENKVIEFKYNNYIQKN